MTKPPNVVFILADQHNAKVLEHQGHPDVKTPNLNRLAAEGTRFDNAVTQNPICTPSRMSFMSGQYCHNHGTYGLSGPGLAGLPNMLGHFRGHGYTSGAFGKIHCPAHWVENSVDTFIETCGGCSINRDPEYQQHIADNNITEEHKLSEGRSGPYGQCMDGYCSPLNFRDTPEGFSVDQSTAFMKAAHDEGKPFITHISFPRPHQTYAPTQEFWDLYDENEITMPPNWQYDWAEAIKSPHLIGTVKDQIARGEEWTVTSPYTYEAGCRRKLRGYLGCVSMVDHAVGEILDFLDREGLAENTIVIYASDHGDYACEHGLIEKAPGICSDAITRIPFIWRFPGTINAGQIQENLAEAIDVAPTLCDLAGLPILESADGKIISNLLKGDNTPVRDLAVTEFAWSKSMRQGNYRFVYYPKDMFPFDYPDGFGELYDLEADPWEMRNLFFDPAHQEQIQSMRNQLMDWLITNTRVTSVNNTKVPETPQTQDVYHARTNSDGKINPCHMRQMVVDRENINYL